jgi:hypothetical protein
MEYVSKRKAEEELNRRRDFRNILDTLCTCAYNTEKRYKDLMHAKREEAFREEKQKNFDDIVASFWNFSNAIDREYSKHSREFAEVISRLIGTYNKNYLKFYKAPGAVHVGHTITAITHGFTL